MTRRVAEAAPWCWRVSLRDDRGTRFPIVTADTEDEAIARGIEALGILELRVAASALRLHASSTHVGGPRPLSVPITIRARTLSTY